MDPIIPQWRKEPFDHPDWTFELKYDGYVASDIAVAGLNRVAVFCCGTSLSLRHRPSLLHF